MERIDFFCPECFWELDNTFIQKCDCKKIFFDVDIDFIPYRLILCKDWYVMQVKAIMAGNHKENGIDLRIRGSEYFNRKYIKDIQKKIIENIIKKYFKTPILDSIIAEDQRQFISFYGYNLHVVICERPYIYYKLDMLKFISFYIYDFSDDYRIIDTYQINKIMDTCILNLHRLCKEKFMANKYLKLRPMISNIKWDKKIKGDKQDRAIELLSDILIELTKLKIKNL